MDMFWGFLLFVAGGIAGWASGWVVGLSVGLRDVPTERIEAYMPPRADLPHPAQIAREEMENYLRELTEDL